ncbi:MAG: EcsC family protein [Microlunatus sp.]|nr:EcsC family protein [Microlunatus sp.]MDN5804495.1 EcsC family protein [Microlunatus sp.]
MTPQVAGGALRQVLEIAIDGTSKLPGAKAHASRQLQRHGGSVDPAIDGIVDFHVRLAGAQGFLTNLGGIAALPVTMPANVAGLAVVQTRMVAAMAHLRGYDLADNGVRTALIMCLLGGEQVAQRIVSGKLPTSPLAIATAPMFDPHLDQRVSEEVLSDLIQRVGSKNLAISIVRRVPILGGGVGAVMDGIATQQIGVYARGELVIRRSLAR